MPVYLVLDGMMITDWRSKDRIEVLIPHVHEHDLLIQGDDGKAIPLARGAATISFGTDPAPGPATPDPYFLKSHFCINGDVVRTTSTNCPLTTINLPKPARLYGAERFVTKQSLMLNSEDPKTLVAPSPLVLLFCERLVMRFDAPSINLNGATASEGNFVWIRVTANQHAAHVAAHGMQAFNSLLSVSDVSGPRATKYKVTGLNKTDALELDGDSLPVKIPQYIRTIEVGCAGAALVGSTAE
jgi:hypothetical protein